MEPRPGDLGDIDPEMSGADIQRLVGEHISLPSSYGMDKIEFRENVYEIVGSEPEPLEIDTCPQCLEEDVESEFYKKVYLDEYGPDEAEVDMSTREKMIQGGLHLYSATLEAGCERHGKFLEYTERFLDEPGVLDDLYP